ncbi:MAG TPA: glycosyltransferase family 2 protein [Vicinamibacterales bacterium]|nr:glycosyltransferase family 2 protein [Vicinamibacterales bacterium]
MKIAAVLGVKDEVELIAASIAHLRAIGVDEVVVSDFGSTDGTLDVLSAERRHGDVTVTRVDPDLVCDYATASAHDVAQAHRTRADWVLFLDADEFFIPVTGRLRDCRLLHEADVLTLDRFNVVITASHLLMPVELSPASYDSLHLFTRQVPDFRLLMETQPDVSFITVRPGPKVMARREAARAIAPGGHDVLSPDVPVRRRQSADLLVAHVPFSTFRRFERKVENIRAEMVHHPRFFEDGYAWHWRRWAEMTEPGAIEREFARQLAEGDDLRRLSEAGLVRSAADLFANGTAGAASPRAGPLERWRGRLGQARPGVTLRPVEPGLADLPAGA